MSINYLILIAFLLPVMGIAQMGGPGTFGNNRGNYFVSGNVEGRVTDSTHQPVKGATVILQQQDAAPNEGTPYYKEIVVKKNGKFSFGALRPLHQYKLTIMAEGYRRLEKDINYSKSTSQKTASELEDTVSMSLPNRKLSSTGRNLGDICLTALPAKPAAKD